LRRNFNEIKACFFSEALGFGHFDDADLFVIVVDESDRRGANGIVDAKALAGFPSGRYETSVDGRYSCGSTKEAAAKRLTRAHSQRTINPCRQYRQPRPVRSKTESDVRPINRVSRRSESGKRKVHQARKIAGRHHWESEAPVELFAHNCEAVASLPFSEPESVSFPFYTSRRILMETAALIRQRHTVSPAKIMLDWKPEP